jgi:hypothetical protein
VDLSGSVSLTLLFLKLVSRSKYRDQVHSISNWHSVTLARFFKKHCLSRPFTFAKPAIFQTDWELMKDQRWACSIFEFAKWH